MKRIFKREHLNSITSYPNEVLNSIQKTILLLDEAYGTERHIVRDLGGYIILVENKDEFELIKQENFIDLECDAIPEFVDLIRCENGKVFTNATILLSSDFSITVVMPLNITPDNIKGYIED
ncbi:hypothetical protein NBE98_08550 [Clostridium swellfunianum]|uniref:hypothetical protein n=1 Tax=Clostridium swellfunianum TaxID=1367462 RepID=UPI00202E47E4|nr:hypothetical protein [Clostridium swellfunianum]MCM0648422.1 hypothetical protein [Clostridium swellfunianum]